MSQSSPTSNGTSKDDDKIPDPSAMQKAIGLKETLRILQEGYSSFIQHILILMGILAILSLAATFAR